MRARGRRRAAPTALVLALLAVGTATGAAPGGDGELAGPQQARPGAPTPEAPMPAPALARSGADAVAIPPEIRERVGRIDGAVALEVIRTPADPFGDAFVARIELAPLREGYRACPDHYPSYFVPQGGACPDIRSGDPPAADWVSCHGAFYAPRAIGCPPAPRTPRAPLTTPRARCDLGAEDCRHDAPGGPVLRRVVEPRPRPVTARARPVEEGVSARALPRARDERLRARPEHLERTAPLAPSERRAAPEDARGSPRAIRPATLAGAVGRIEVSPGRITTGELARRIGIAHRPVVQLDIAERLPGLELADQRELNAPLTCDGDECHWGGGEAPILLPRPPVTPRRHVPCDYGTVAFFVAENRYCPREALGERPAPGASLYVAWPADDPRASTLYYHRDDFSGLDMTAAMIFGGSDDRYPILEATDLEKAAARATAMLVRVEHTEARADGFVDLTDDPNWRPLCSGERFSGLPQPGQCSAVKIGERLVATSAHCIRTERQCGQTAVVFGFDGARLPAAVPRGAVYRCTAIVAARHPAAFGERGADWAILEVDRAIDAPSAVLADSSNVRQSDVVTVIGHPLGLPSVVTRLGVVQVTTSRYFIANSDTFVGNSGSAVFAAQSVEDEAPRVLGLLTGGGYDFVDSLEDGAPCVRARWCDGLDCLGDDVVYTDDLILALERLASAGE